MNSHTHHISLSARYVALKSVNWFFMALVLGGLALYTRPEGLFLQTGHPRLSNIDWEEYVFLFFLAAVFFARCVYAYIYRQFFGLSVSEHSLGVSRGILLRTHTSIPLQKVTQVNIGRDFMHLITGLYFLEISFPMYSDVHGSAHSQRIEGLSRRDAILVRNFVYRSFIGNNRNEISPKFADSSLRKQRKGLFEEMHDDSLPHIVEAQL